MLGSTSVRLLTPRPGFKAAATGLFSTLKVVKLRLRYHVAFTYLLTNIFQGLQGIWRMGVSILGRRLNVAVYLGAIRLSQYISQVCIPVMKPETYCRRACITGKERASSVRRSHNTRWGREWRTCGLLVFIGRKPRLRKRTFDWQLDCRPWLQQKWWH